MSELIVSRATSLVRSSDSISASGVVQTEWNTTHRPPRLNTPLLATILVVSLLFGLPHLLIPQILGPNRPYTPFATSGVSALTYDETSAYAAYVNYTLHHAAVPFDTDVFENRDIPLPVSVVPYVALAAFAAVVGGVEHAFIISDFLIPPLALCILYFLLLDFTPGRGLALCGALATLLVPFGPRNMLEVPLDFITHQTAAVIQPLEYSRLIHPQFSFTLFAAALLLLWRTFRSGSLVTALLAGTTGALLFYTYVYYWPIWVSAGAMLLLLGAQVGRKTFVSLTAANVVTWLGSLPFWFIYLQATAYPNFGAVLGRHTSEAGHIPPPGKLVYTAVCCAVFVGFVTLYRRFGAAIGQDSLERKLRLSFFSSIFASSVLALNMEVFTGFNAESMLHFPNRVFQPFSVLAAFAFVVPAIGPLIRELDLNSMLTYGRSAVAVGSVCLIAIAGARQVLVSYNVAGAHENVEQHRLLFSWLESNTKVDDVVLAAAKDINELIPVYTHDRVFVPSAERTSAATQDIAHRFLIAMKLLQNSEQGVRALLARDHDQGDPPLGLTYTYFLFLGVDNWRLADSDIDVLLSEFRSLDLSRELGRWRIDYVYGRGVEKPAEISGWTFTQSYADAYGHLWRIQPNAVGAPLAQ